jgi:glutaredoxin-like protein NrdH
MKVIVHHIGPACVQCNQTKRLMDQLEIRYEEIDLRERPDLTASFKEMNHLTAPIVVAGNEIWSGFKYERIKGLAHKFRQERND